MRTFVSFATFALFASAAAAQQPYSNEPNTYRYGGTYKTVNASTANSCSSLCGQEQTCQAWSFQRPTRGYGGAKCELKSTIGRAVNNPLMISGINPRIAAQGQSAPRTVVSSDNILLGAPTTRQPATVVRNATASAPVPLAPAPVTRAPITRVPVTRAPIVRAAPPPAPAPIIRATPTPPPVRQFTPAPLPPAPAPIVRAVPSQVPAPTPAPIQTLRPAPIESIPAVPIQPLPQVPAQTAAPAPVRSVTTQPVLQPGEFSSPLGPVATSVPSRVPAPVPAPIVRAPVVPTPAPIAPPPSQQRIDVPVTQSELPPGSVLRESPPPQISFRPLDAVPAPAPAPVPTPSIAPPPVPAAVSPPPARQPEFITLPRSKDKKTPSATQLTTVPAGSIPPPVATEATPYNNLRNRAVPNFSVNNDTVLTPEQFEAQEKQAREIIESVDIDSVDIANDVGQPLDRNALEQRQSGGGGS